MKASVLVGCLVSSVVSAQTVRAQNNVPDRPAAESPAVPVPAEPYVLVCLRNSPPATRLSLTAEDAERYNVYRLAMPKVAEDMVRQPYPQLARPLLDGDVVVLEGIAWDKSISRAMPGNYNINLYKPGTPQTCRLGFQEIGKFPVRQR